MEVNYLQEPSYKSLFIEMYVNTNNGEAQKLASGTGFLVNSLKGPLLITNRHNVTGRDNITKVLIGSHKPDFLKIYHNVSENPIPDSQLIWTPRNENLYVEYEPRWIEHPILKDAADFIALPLTDVENVLIAPFNLNIHSQLKDVFYGPSDIISVVGFPFGMSVAGFIPIWATGFIASEPFIDYNGLPVFLIDCRSRQGQSGSPVVLHSNKGSFSIKGGGNVEFFNPVTILLGIYSGRINPESDIGIVWKREAINELVQHYENL